MCYGDNNTYFIRVIFSYLTLVYEALCIILSMVLTLKNKELVILPAKWIYLGIAEELQCGTSKLWLTVGKSKFRGKGLAFREEKEDDEKGRMEDQGVNGFSLVECGSFSLAGLFPGAQT